MLSILDKYIIKKFLGTYFFSIALIISIAVVFDINEQLDKFIANNAPLKAIVFQYYVNFIPFYANLFSALFVFIAVIFFTSKMANNSEVIAMLASGVSFRRLMKPYLISAGAIAILSFLLSSFVIPPANVVRIKFQNKYIRNKAVDVASNILMQVQPGVIAYIGRYDNFQQAGDFFSLDKFKGNELVSRLTASKIQYVKDHHWIILNYNIREFHGLQTKLKSGDRIDTTLNLVPSDFLIAVNDFEQMTTPQLYTYIKRQDERGVGNSIRAFVVDYHKRFAAIVSAFILTIIGASLSSRKIKGGMGLNIGLGLLLSVAYILLMTVSSTFASSGAISPAIAVWIPNLIFAAIAGYLYSKAPN